MKAYQELVRFIMDKGKFKSDRTGTGTKSYFGKTIEVDLRDGFPLLTHKKMGTKSIFAELVWFMAGDTNSHRLEELGSTIWREWADEDGDIGPMYGAAWRGKQGHPVDQLAGVLQSILHNPESRRMYVSAWKPELLPDTRYTPVENVKKGKMALAPCHVAYQFYVEDDTLHLKWEQRSSDTAIGLPYNIASYAALLHIMAFLTGLTAGRLIASLGDVHLYKDHIESGAVKEILKRPVYGLPDFDLVDSYKFNRARKLLMTTHSGTPIQNYSSILDYLFLDSPEVAIHDLRAAVTGYESGAPIKMSVSV